MLASAVKLAELSPRCSAIGQVRLFRVVKDSKVLRLTVDLEFCNPTATRVLEANSLVAGQAVLIALCVSPILYASGLAQVAPAVVGLFCVLMVYLAGRPSTCLHEPDNPMDRIGLSVNHDKTVARSLINAPSDSSSLSRINARRNIDAEPPSKLASFSIVRKNFANKCRAQSVAVSSVTWFPADSHSALQWSRGQRQASARTLRPASPSIAYGG